MLSSCSMRTASCRFLRAARAGDSSCGSADVDPRPGSGGHRLGLGAPNRGSSSGVVGKEAVSSSVGARRIPLPASTSGLFHFPLCVAAEIKGGRKGG
jgi:hypothetical protein